MIMRSLPNVSINCISAIRISSGIRALMILATSIEAFVPVNVKKTPTAPRTKSVMKRVRPTDPAV
jgi:hypothetical protein